jgi:hypothetical protein
MSTLKKGVMPLISDVRWDLEVKIAASNKASTELASSRGSGSRRLLPLAG